MFSFVKKKTKFHEFAQIFSKLFELKMVLDYLPNLFPLRQEMLFMLHQRNIIILHLISRIALQVSDMLLCIWSNLKAWWSTEQSFRKERHWTKSKDQRITNCLKFLIFDLICTITNVTNFCKEFTGIPVKRKLFHNR